MNEATYYNLFWSSWAVSNRMNSLIKELGSMLFSSQYSEFTGDYFQPGINTHEMF